MTSGTRSLIIALVVFCIASATWRSSPRATAAAHSAAARTCKIVKKHGKKVRVCRKKRPAPTPTATPRPPGLFTFPAGIALDASGDVYVADALGNRVVKLSPDGQVIARIGTSGTAPGQLLQPWGVTLDPQGNLYVSETPGIVIDQRHDAGPRRIQKLSPSGQPLAAYTASALGMDVPCGLALDASGDLYVADFGDGQILKLDRNGRPLGHIATVDPWPCGIVLDQAGNLYASQGLTEDVGKYAPDGTRVGTLGGTARTDPGFGVALDGNGDLVTIAYATEEVLRLSPSGQVLARWGGRGTAPGKFLFDRRHFLGIAADEHGNVYVSDQGNKRVQKFSPTGQLLAIWK